MAQTWHNRDKLLLKYGTDKAASTQAGEYRTAGRLHEVEVKIDLTTLTETETIQSDVQVLPKNARIQEVEVVTHTAAATGTSIDIGLIKADRSTELDYNGLVAGLVTASMNAAGEKTVLTDNTTYDGALVGTTLSELGYISASRTDSTAFTAGVVYVTIRYYVV